MSDPSRSSAPGLSRRPLFILGLTAVLLVGGVVGVAAWLQAQRSLGSEVAQLARPGDIRMLASQDCSICPIARAWFREHGVAYGECVIERDPRCRADFDALRAQGTPVLLVRGQPIMGFEPHRLREMLRAPS
jgi:glutaredoxin